MRTALNWILLILLAGGSIVGTYALSEKFRTDARQVWEAKASQSGRWLSGTVLTWLDESYAPLSGLAILFENSREVSEIEFLGATDALEARATTIFLDAQAVARPRAKGDGWFIEFSNDPLGPLSPDIPLEKHPVILDTIKVAVEHPDQNLLGAPFPGEQGIRYSPVVLAIRDVRGPLVIIGLVNYDAIVRGLFDMHQLDGLQLQIQGRFKEIGGPGPLREVIGNPQPEALHSVTTRTVSAGADLSITWHVSGRFSKGPQVALANITFMGGIGGTLLLVLFFGLLLLRNRTISKKVDEATEELAESRQRLDLALASSGIGTWDWNIANDTVFWDQALHRILGTDPDPGSLDMTGLTKLVHPQDAQRFESELNEALAGQKDYASEYRFLRPNGDVRTLEARGHVIRDAVGRPLRFIGTIMDITERKRAEEELRKLSLAVEQSPASVVITDPRGTIEYVNPKFSEVTGYSAKEAIGQNPRILKSGQTPDEVYQDLWQTLGTGNDWRGELINKKKNGELYWESVSITPITDDDGSVKFYLAVKQDITEAKQMEKSIWEKEARFRGYFEYIQVGMAVTSATKGWIEVNGQLQKMLGYTLDELQQMTWAEITHPDDLEADAKQFELMLAGEIDNYTLDKRFIRKDGEIVDTNLTAACVRYETGDVNYFLASFQDVTERKKMEADQHERIKELDEAQSAMLNMMEDLDEEKSRAEEATRAKSDFLANMSHEIRTPMNAVIGMSHLALKTELTPKQQDYLSKIQSSANSLLGIINDILDFSKIEAGKLDMEAVEFDLLETMDNVANVITVKAQERENLEVLFYIDPQVPNFLVGDSLRLNQILVNLGNNAVKFTEQGEIVLSVRVNEKRDDKIILQFSVRDTGIGMTAEQQGKLFQAFSQADTSTTRKYGGTGLGLTISKRLVGLMGGEIWIDSEAGQGTTFNFTSDFGLGKETVKRIFEPSSDLRGLKVLVVDDNATSREILHDILESFTFEVYLAASGEEALEEVERADKGRPFELILMDWKMPGMDGIQASRRIKDHPALSKKPAIVLVTAYGREEIMRQADEIGLEGFLLKPVNSSVLFDAIMQALGREVHNVQRAGQSDEPGAEELSTISGARVLLVEDNEINQQVAREILQGAGLVVTVANNGQEGVDAASRNQYDVILMDIQMPVMDGYAATDAIRNLKSEIRNIPILAMTAHAMAGDEQKSLQAGMNDHVTKPIDPVQLFAALQKWIKPVAERAVDSKSLPKPGGPTEIDPPPEPDRAVPDQAELPESLPGFDLAAGLQRLMGNKRLYKKLLVDFGSKYTETAADIRNALDARDFEQAHALIHNLKGLAGNLEAGDLQAATVEMEKMVKGQTEETVSAPELNLKFSNLEDALNRALEAVKILVPPDEKKTIEDGGDETASASPELDKEAVDRIKEAVEMGDVMRVQIIANELRSANDAPAPLCDELIRLADDFDFDGILKLMLELGS